MASVAPFAQRADFALPLGIATTAGPFAMRIFLHLLNTLVLLPYAVIATGFLLLGVAISGRTLGGFLLALLDIALLMIPWGILGFLCAFCCIAALGFSDRWRWVGALCVCVAAAFSLGTIVMLSSTRLDAGQWLFLLPCVLVLVSSTWIAVGAWPYFASAVANPAIVEQPQRDIAARPAQTEHR